MSPKPFCQAPLPSRKRTGLENRRLLVRSQARPIFFSKMDDSHCDRIHSLLNVVHCFENGYVEKQPLAWNK